MKNQAPNINLYLSFYQDGIIQARLAVDGEDDRFSISSTGIGVDWDSLNKDMNPYQSMSNVSNGIQYETTTENGDNIKYVIQFAPFRIV